MGKAEHLGTNLLQVNCRVGRKPTKAGAPPCSPRLVDTWTLISSLLQEEMGSLASVFVAIDHLVGDCPFGDDSDDIIHPRSGGPSEDDGGACAMPPQPRKH